MRFTSVCEALSHLFLNAGLLSGTGCVCRCWLWTGLETVWKHVMVYLTETAMRKCLGCCSAPWEMCCARNCSTPVLTMCICATLSSPHTGKTDSFFPLFVLANKQIIATIDRVSICQQLFVFVWYRKLGMAGQKLGASALLCYIHHEPSDPGGNLSLTVANVGTCQAVLCRDGRPVPLSKVYSLENCTEEMERVKLSKAIITEVTHSFHVCLVPVLD